METYPTELLAIAFAAMLAPLLSASTGRFRIPVVVSELLLGILIGPNVLHLASVDGMVGTLSELGLAFLLFMVGMEIDFNKIKGKPLNLAVAGWGISLIFAVTCMFFFSTINLIQTPPLLAGIALSTTALGILIPILRDRGELNTEFGTYMIATAAIGELGPLLALSLVVTSTHGFKLHILFIFVFIIITLISANIAIKARPSRFIEILTYSMHRSGQLPIRICILLQILFVALSSYLGLDFVIGAFTAGILVGLATKDVDSELLRHKLDAVGYGFLIPVFFIVAGMKFDVSALWLLPMAPIQIALLSGLLLLVRGLPIILYRKVLKPDDQLPFIFYSATGLPLIVIISEIGVSTGVMPADRASILMGAGMLSVLLFPVLAAKLRGKFIFFK